ncbi:Os10g0439025 [Oryza sativa Japonica Group]|uniref:Os10g0439025 protein n=1 Tax=Oryza sativa subsp. japonica TaxID=39947 RepID=A0A0P0XUN9_ORYSJ|nr:Os10g0439025 [Oryza sativa Japonica Group]
MALSLPLSPVFLSSPPGNSEGARDGDRWWTAVVAGQSSARISRTAARQGISRMAAPAVTGMTLSLPFSTSCVLSLLRYGGNRCSDVVCHRRPLRAFGSPPLY